jgi:uncharacterized membrane protein YfcA
MISGVIGMAGGVTLMAFMTFALEFKDIIPIHGLVQLTSNSSRSLLLRNHVKFNLFWAFACGTPIGTVGAFYVAKSITNEKVFIFPLIILIAYTLLKPKKLPSIKIEEKGFFLLGIVASFLSPLIGATGPLLAPFFLRDDFTKEEIVATKALTQTLTHFLKIPLFISLAFPYDKYLIIIVSMSVCAVIGTRIGTMLLGKISKELFVVIYKTAMFLALGKLIYKLIMPLS